MVKNATLLVQGIEINVSTVGEEDFISLTDMVSGFEGGETMIISWLRNKDTIEFLGVWERINNPNFNPIEFDRIRNESGTNRFILSAKRWIQGVKAIGLVSKAGRYGGTYAHKDIAFEFGSWLSPEFKLYLIKEFQRLKVQESQSSSVAWQVKRELAKVNYKIQTDAIQQNLLAGVDPNKHGLIYANEADLINSVVFGLTHQEWKSQNPDLTGNQRDHASIMENAIVANLESTNGSLIDLGMSMGQRAVSLRSIANRLRKTFADSPTIKRMEREDREQQAQIEKSKD
jgi:hypothetical protein